MAKEIQLPPDTFDKLKQAKETLDAADVFLNKAAAGGIDVSERKKVNADLRKQITGIRTAFFADKTL